MYSFFPNVRFKDTKHLTKVYTLIIRRIETFVKHDFPWNLFSMIFRKIVPSVFIKMKETFFKRSHNT